MTEEGIAALVDRAIDDPEFRLRALDDLDGALAEASFDLSEEEMEAVREFHGEVAGLSDDELIERLAGARLRQRPFFPV